VEVAAKLFLEKLRNTCEVQEKVWSKALVDLCEHLFFSK
jgi:hypothetical protein